MKTCTKCKVEKSLKEFAIHPNGRQGRNPACKVCLNAAASQRYLDYPERRQKRVSDKSWAYDLKRKFGISPEKYWTLFSLQDGKCKICQKAPTTDRRLAVDHNHETGIVRGLLCFNCNSGLGKFYDDPNLLKDALAYLED